MLVGYVATEPGGSKVMNLAFWAFADRLSPSVQRVRRERASIALFRFFGRIWAAESGRVVIGAAPLQSSRRTLTMARKPRYLLPWGLRRWAKIAHRPLSSPLTLPHHPLCSPDHPHSGAERFS